MSVLGTATVLAEEGGFEPTTCGVRVRRSPS
jgi:hypothetical protein